MSNTISEADFLVTELRYTLGQMHVQILDLDDTMRAQQAEGRSVNSILGEMVKHEEAAQQRYAELLGDSRMTEGGDEPVPLPLSSTEEDTGPEGEFEHRRAHTIAMLEQTSGAWSDDLLAAVREQVRGDRQCTTALAECRKAIVEQDFRPDLSEPLAQP